MSNTAMQTGKHGPYSDLRDAIERSVLVRAEDGAIIVGSEHTGVRESWIFDFRALMLQAQWLNRYAEIFWELYAPKYPFQVGGVETAGIPLVAAIVMKGYERGTPVNGFYLRKSRKRDGLMHRIEGTLTDEPVIFVDDLIHSGQSINRQLEVLTVAGKRVTDVFVLLAFRDESAYDFIRAFGAEIRALFSLADFGLSLRVKGPEIPAHSFEVVWHYRSHAPSYHLVVQKSTPLHANGFVYMGFDDGVFRALDAASGALVWEFRIGRHPIGKGILSSPAAHADVVYFGAYDGTVYALNARTGALVWRYADADWVGSSPSVAPDLNMLFIGLEYGLVGRRGGIVALDLGTGREQWRAYHPRLTHGSPLYIPEEKMVVIGSNDGILYAYGARDGALRWKFPTRGDIKTRAAYDSVHRSIVFGSLDGTVYAVSAVDGSPRFAHECGPLYGTPLIRDGLVYVPSLDKNLYALDLATGRVRWTFETAGRIFASPSFANGSLWIGSNDGRVYELDPATGVLSRFFQATDRIVNPIAVDESGGELFVSTQANDIYCLRAARTK